MPFYGAQEETNYAAATQAKASAPTAEQKDYVTEYNAGLDKGILTSTAALTLGGAVDLADTVASSVLPGVQRQDVNQKFMHSVGAPGFSKWMDENRGAVEVGSGIAGVVISDWAAGKLLKPAGAAMNFLRKVPGVKTVANLDYQYERAKRVATLATMESAARGTMGVDRFIGESMTLARLGAKPIEITSKAAAGNLIKAQLAKGLARNVTTEAIMATTLHTNSFLYADDFAHNLAWSAAGLGIGAAVDKLAGTYALRKIANSDQVRKLNQRAFDPSGIETQRLHAYDVADNLIRQSSVGSVADTSWQRYGGGVHMDNATSLAIQAQELKLRPGTSQRAQSLAPRREELATPILGMAMEEANKVTVRGINGVSGSGFSTRVEGLGKPINQSFERTPESMYGIEEIGTAPESMTRLDVVQQRAAALQERWDKTQKLLLQDGKWVERKVKVPGSKDLVPQSTLVPLNPEERLALQQEALRLNDLRTYSAHTMLEPGEWSPMSWGQIADGYEPRAVEVEGTLGADDLAVWQMERKHKAEPRLGISSQGDVFLPEAARGKPENLTPQEALQLYNVGNKAVRDLARNGKTLMVPKNASWFVLDMAEQLIKATGNDSQVKYWRGMTREEALVESFAQKIDILKRKQHAQKMAAKRGIDTTIDDATAFGLKVQLNLPRLTPYQAALMNGAEHPIDVLTHGFKSGAEVRGMSYQELLKGINDAREIVGFTDKMAPTLDALHGNSYNFLRDAEGNPMKPIIGFRRPQRPMEWSRDQLFTRQALAETNLRDDLLGNFADDATKAWVNTLTSDPAFAMARQVMQLGDDQSRSFLPGATHSAPQTTVGAFVNAITSRGRRDVDNLIMKAASQIQELKTRVTQRLSREIFDTEMGGVITELTSQRNARSLMLANQFISFRPGWELLAKPVELTLQDGTAASKFVLDHTSVMNQKRFREAFGRDLEKGQEFLNPDGKTVVLDELAMKAISSMQGVHERTFAMKNTLLRSQNLPELKSVPWYVPPPVAKNKYVEYTFNMADEVVPGMTIIADTPQELAKLRSELRNSDQWKDGYHLRSRDAVESFMTLWDKAQMEFIAPNTTAIQPKKTNFGRTGGNQINMMAFQESLGVMLESIQKHGDDLIDVLYEPVIKSARARAAVASEATTVGSRKAVEHSSIYDRYLQNLTGRSALSAKDSFFGDPYKWLEQRLNGFLAEGSNLKEAGKEKIFGVYRDYLRAANPKTPIKGTQFDQFSQALGPYMPFKDAAALAARQSGSHTPSEVADITSKMSWFEASSRLRWFESMHAMVNFGSMVANMPSVLKALQPMKGESAVDAALRNSSLTMLMNVGSKDQVVLPNAPRLLWQSMRDAQKGVRDEFTQKAISLGFMDQEVAEYQQAFNAINSKAGWRKFMFGNPEAKTRIGKKGIDGVLGFMSDSSEAFTRQWGMYAGRRTAEAMGIHDVDAQLNFAHGMVNDMIANYDPRNRAEIFQGALGAPLGLFQSYTINFYQRMFRYLETGNTRALATQYATQAGIFGTSSLPGWNEVNWAFFDRGQGENSGNQPDVDPIESLEKRLGKNAADLYMHGLLSNLPKLVGADGMAVYTRGDTQFRMPVQPLNMIKGDAVVSIPMTDTIGRVFDGIGQAAAQVKAMDGKIGLNQIAEIASNVITNRPIAGFIEIAGAGGYDTDKAGQVVAESAIPSMAAMYRILGTRSMAQQKQVEHFYSSRNAQEEQASRKDVLNIATRQAIRDERYDQIPGLFAKYVEEGGDPRQYSSWLKRSFEAATSTRSERLLDKAMRDPNNQSNAYISRLLDGETDVAEDENNTDDYGREAQMTKMIQDGWETTPTATMPAETEDPSQALTGW